MTVLESFYAKARARRGRIVLPEIGDERIQEAARRLKAEGLAEPILPDIANDPRLEHYASLYPNPRLGARAVRNPLFHAGLMVK